MKTKEDTKNRARELVAVSPFGKVRVKKSFRTCSLPFDCPTIKEAPNGCADCIADAIVSLTKLDERNRMNKYLNDKLGYDYSGIRPYEILTGLDFHGRFSPEVKE